MDKVAAQLLDAAKFALTTQCHPQSRTSVMLAEAIIAFEAAQIADAKVDNAGDWYALESRKADHIRNKIWAEKNSANPKPARIAQLERELEMTLNVGD